MKIHKLIIELTHNDAYALRDLITGFFDYQKELGCGEGSARIILAEQLLRILPHEGVEANTMEGGLFDPCEKGFRKSE